MKTSKALITAASLVVIFASGMAVAAPHPGSNGAAPADHKAVMDAAFGIQVKGQGTSEKLSGAI